MACFGCGFSTGLSPLFKSLSRAAAKSAAAKLRGLRALPVYQDWASRAVVCEGCPVRRVFRGVSYCGNPYLQKPVRDAMEGCGCPTAAKAKDSGEHCPLNVRNREADRAGGQCDCKWCAAGRA
jgi:hypothetical protein